MMTSRARAWTAISDQLQAGVEEGMAPEISEVVTKVVGAAAAGRPLSPEEVEALYDRAQQRLIERLDRERAALLAGGD